MFDHAVTADLSTLFVGASAYFVIIGLILLLLVGAFIWQAARHDRDMRVMHQQMTKMWEKMAAGGDVRGGGSDGPAVLESRGGEANALKPFGEKPQRLEGLVDRGGPVGAGGGAERAPLPHLCGAAVAQQGGELEAPHTHQSDQARAGSAPPSTSSSVGSSASGNTYHFNVSANLSGVPVSPPISTLASAPPPPAAHSEDTAPRPLPELPAVSPMPCVRGEVEPAVARAKGALPAAPSAARAASPPPMEAMPLSPAAPALTPHGSAPAPPPAVAPARQATPPPAAQPFSTPQRPRAPAADTAADPLLLPHVTGVQHVLDAMAQAGISVSATPQQMLHMHAALARSSPAAVPPLAPSDPAHEGDPPSSPAMGTPRTSS
jgi:hypothetical protein